MSSGLSRLFARKRKPGAGEKRVVVFDLDGVLATRDIALDLFSSIPKGVSAREWNALNPKQRENASWGPFFRKSSDEIARAVTRGEPFKGKPSYAGQTLAYVMNHALANGARISVNDLHRIAHGAKVMPGAKKAISDLKKDPNVELFVLTTTYRPAANVIADKLGIPRERVIGTELRVENGLVTGVNGPARGGIHKAEAVEELSKRLGVPINKFTVVGDSITDKDMVERVARERGLAISFNANKDLLAKNPTVVVAGKSLRRVSTLVRAFAERGEEGVERVVKRNALLRRLVIPRPFLKVHMFKGAGAGPAEAERAAKASEKYRRLTRKAKYARLR